MALMAGLMSALATKRLLTLDQEHPFDPIGISLTA